MIYFLRSGTAKPVKIGYTMDLDTRLYKLRLKYRVPLDPIRIIPAGRKWAEGWLHRQFIESRIVGEWFLFDDQMMAIQLPRNPEMMVNFAINYKPLPSGPRVSKGITMEDEIHDLILAENAALAA